MVSRTGNTTVPATYRTHRLIAKRVFYTLPERLLVELKRQFAGRGFDKNELNMEFVLATQLSHDPGLVGYRDGMAFSHPVLAPDTFAGWNPPDKHLRKLSLNRAKWKLLRAEASEKMAPGREALRGYCGWLLTNPQFLKERDRLLKKWKTRIEANGIPLTGPTMIGKPTRGGLARKATGKQEMLLRDFEAFYAQWRLLHLVTPELPLPLSPQMPVLQPQSLLTHMKTGGVTLYQPDTMPIPRADDLRDALEDQRQAHEAEHLKEWVEIVRKNRPTDHSIHRYAQLFLVRHYWSQLEARHGEALKGNIGRAQKAFAEYLGFDVSTVDKYRQQIRRRLRVAR